MVRAWESNIQSFSLTRLHAKFYITIFAVQYHHQFDIPLWRRGTHPSSAILYPPVRGAQLPRPKVSSAFRVSWYGEQERRQHLAGVMNHVLSPKRIPIIRPNTPQIPSGCSWWSISQHSAWIKRRFVPGGFRKLVGFLSAIISLPACPTFHTMSDIVKDTHHTKIANPGALYVANPLPISH